MGNESTGKGPEREKLSLSKAAQYLLEECRTGCRAFKRSLDFN